MEPRGDRITFLVGDWRDGEPSRKLELKEAVVFILEDDVPDLAGILVAKSEGRWDLESVWNWHGW
jgi:hypothetical protein